MSPKSAPQTNSSTPSRATSRSRSVKTTQSAEVSPLRIVQAAIQAGQFDPVYYLHGDDDYLKDENIRELLDATLDPSTKDFNCEIRRASDLDAESTASLLQTPPMLAARRAVVIRDVTAAKKAARAVLDRYLQNPAADTLLLLTSSAGTKPDSALLEKATSLSYTPLSPERVRKWIAYHAESVHSAKVTNEAAALLEQAVGNDLRLLAAELDKCVSYAAHDISDGLTINEDIVADIVGVRRGETTVDLLDAVAHRDSGKAVALVEHVLSQPKVTAVQIVMMLSTQAFALGFGCSRREAGVSLQRLPQEYFAFLKETGGFPGRPWGEAVSAWTKVTDRWNVSQCEEALRLLLEADMALKDTTVSNPTQILMSLVLGLCATGTSRISKGKSKRSTA